jgi:RecA/RadA recombinase
MWITVLQNIPTGCELFDRILMNGFQRGSISLVYGEPETGKTTLAIQCAISCARQGCKTLFVDCDNTFSAKRLSEITLTDFQKVSELINLMQPKSFEEQTLVIEQLPTYLTKNFGLVVFDTITSLYSEKLAEQPDKAFKLNRELNRLIASLAQTALTEKVAVLVTSQVRSVFNEDYVSIEPVATRVVKFWADTIVNMRPTENPKVIKAVIEKHPKMAQNFFCLLKIEESGIQEYSAR